MKCFSLLIFCFAVVYNPAHAQFKNVKIAEIKNPQRLAIFANATDLKKWCVATDSGLFNSNDNGQTWEFRSSIKFKDSLLNSFNSCKNGKGETYTVFVEGSDLKIRMENTRSSQTKMVAPFLSGQTYLVNGKIKANGLPMVACDLSNSEYRGRIYVCWSDEKYGVTNKDVFLVYSDDNCESWTEPILVTYRPNHKEQFMPRLALDQNNGFVYIVYYDQQNSADGKFADVMLARSTNGGLLFDYHKINQRPVDLSGKTELGNSIGLGVSHFVIRPLWLQRDPENKLSLFTALVDENNLAADTTNRYDNLIIEKTFAYSDVIKVNFELKQKTLMTVILTNPLDHKFEKLIFKNNKMKKGHNRFVLNNKKLGIPKGNYTLTFYYDNRNTYVWVVTE